MVALSKEDKRPIALCLLKILRKYSDEGHPMTYDAIIAKFKEDYNMETSRNTLTRQIELLRDGLDYDIVDGKNRQGKYLADRLFEDIQLKALMDSVLTSKYIPQGNAKELLDKLESLGNDYFPKQYRHMHSYDQWNHLRSPQFFASLEMIEEAILQHKQFVFTYNKRAMDGTLVVKGRDKRLVAHPFDLVCIDGQYYMIATIGTFDNLTHYRVDRMTNVLLSDKRCRTINTVPGYEKESKLKLAEYVRDHIWMFGGKVENITFKMAQNDANIVWDEFGNKAVMKSIKDSDDMEVYVKTTRKGAKLFAQKYLGICEIIEPKSLRAEFKAELQAAVKKY